MKSLVLAVTLFASTVGCNSSSAPPLTTSAATTLSSSAQALVSTPTVLTLDRSQKAGCPLQWTCDFIHYFAMKAACVATSCGAECTRDFNCNGSCVCP